MSDKTEFSSVDELLEQFQQVHLLKDWGILMIGQEPRYGIVHHLEPVRNGSTAPRVVVADRQQLVEMAKAILQKLDPTPGQEILDTLRRIEVHLKENKRP